MKILLTILLLLAVANMVASRLRTRYCKIAPCPWEKDDESSIYYCDDVQYDKYLACLEEHQDLIKQHQARPSKLSYDNCDWVPAEEYFQCLATHRRSSKLPVYRSR